MRHLLRPAVLATAILSQTVLMHAQTKSNVAPAPKAVSLAQLNDISAFEGQLIELTAPVRHADTAQVFTLGAEGEREIHVVVPNPATDAASAGDTVALTGFVRRFDGAAFERDYSWFRRADYPDVHGGDWVIVAVSVRTPEGTDLVPPMTISTTPPGPSSTK